MDMTKFRLESHVAQQSRRDKLRVQQSNSSGLVQNLDHFPASLEQGPSDVRPGLNPDLVHVRNVRNANLLYDPIFVESSQQSDDWMVGYGGGDGLAGRESNQNPMFVGEVLSNNERVNNISAAAAMQYLDKPNYSAYQDVHFTLSNNPVSETSSQVIKKQYGNLHFISTSLYQNALGQDDVTTASLPHQNVREAARGSWMDYQASGLQFDTAGACMNRPVALDWGGELGFLASKGSHEMRAAGGASDATSQGLSLSLSSNPTPKIYDAATKTMKGDQLCSTYKPSITSKGSGMALQDATGGASTYLNRHTGPLGPFTGYATILNNSRFLKPAQELLDEFCHISNLKLVKACENASEGISGEVSASASTDAANVVDADAAAAIKGNNSGVSCSTFYSCDEMRVDVGVGSSSSESCRPEYQQKKAKLLSLQEEVCRRYKVYYQQMQMVVSSFESVAGLSAATPYVSLALKMVARNFQCLRNAISDQIRHLSGALGEDLISPTTVISSSKGDINMSRLKYVGQKSGGVNMGFLDPQQHGLRPQRGLPERSVAILRAWLFEHFLHPYPTDTDKHMLAAQTGLSRNQVSNWFINARVRVWKPMVEEIHMLESKGMAAEVGRNLSKSDGKSTSEGGSIRPNEDQSINRSCMNANAMSDKHFGCADMLVAGIAGDAHDSEQWNHEKQSRVDFHNPTNMEGLLMGFVPYQQSRLEMGGLGPVSLTLGLRHGVESAQQQYQQQDDQLRGQYGGQMIHDFAG